MENKLSLTPSQLVTMADEESQILCQSNQWVETIDPSIFAMQALLQGTNTANTQLLKTLTVHFSSSTKSKTMVASQETRSSHNGGWSRQYGNDNPPWVYDAPKDMSQMWTFRSRVWSYCGKCGRDGKWVCTHIDATHKEGLRSSSTSNNDENFSRYDHNVPDKWHDQWFHDGMRSRSQTPPSSWSSSPMHDRSRSISFLPSPQSSPRAKLSLLDSINAFIDDEWALLCLCYQK